MWFYKLKKRGLIVKSTHKTCISTFLIIIFKMKTEAISVSHVLVTASFLFSSLEKHNKRIEKPLHTSGNLTLF